MWRSSSTSFSRPRLVPHAAAERNLSLPETARRRLCSLRHRQSKTAGPDPAGKSNHTQQPRRGTKEPRGGELLPNGFEVEAPARSFAPRGIRVTKKRQCPARLDAVTGHRVLYSGGAETGGSGGTTSTEGLSGCDVLDQTAKSFESSNKTYAICVTTVEQVPASAFACSNFSKMIRIFSHPF